MSEEDFAELWMALTIPVNYVARWTTSFKVQTNATIVEPVMATDLITHDPA